MAKPKAKSGKQTEEIKDIALRREDIDAQIKIFTQDLNKLIEKDPSFQYLKERILRLGQITDYKTIAQFFRIIAFQLYDKLAGMKSLKPAEIIFDEKKIAEKDAEIEKLNKDIENFKEEFIKVRNKIENIKHEEQDAIKKKIFLSLLPILDNFTLAVKAKDEKADFKTVCDGFFMIYEQFKKVFEKESFREISYIGEKFNPEFQEVIQQIEDNEKESGIIVEEARKAYFYGNKLIRPAMVKIIK